MIQIQHYESPCGELILGSFEGKLCLCDWMFEKRRASIDKRIQKALGADYEEGVSDVIRKTIIQLDEYFARQRKTFDIPLVFTGTEFQNSVWQELLDIPYGKTVSYRPSGRAALRTPGTSCRRIWRTACTACWPAPA